MEIAPNTTPPMAIPENKMTASEGDQTGRHGSPRSPEGADGCALWSKEGLPGVDRFGIWLSLPRHFRRWLPPGNDLADL